MDGSDRSPIQSFAPELGAGGGTKARQRKTRTDAAQPKPKPPLLPEKHEAATVPNPVTAAQLSTTQFTAGTPKAGRGGEDRDGTARRGEGSAVLKRSSAGGSDDELKETIGDWGSGRGRGGEGSEKAGGWLDWKEGSWQFYLRSGVEENLGCSGRRANCAHCGVGLIESERGIDWLTPLLSRARARSERGLGEGVCVLRGGKRRGGGGGGGKIRRFLLLELSNSSCQSWGRGLECNPNREPGLYLGAFEQFHIRRV
ncbi:hypothetical protein AXG93_2891s1310 [Marchantia polymorpha subsp. ruderalis]|uniref:Uncharacterized protein n=1 Tax=Marchantia polymorpha subsp. ruderalis TaxID=1480154 RepID=A0A176WPD6_MARPO|nr:hypothetical protein AXG93_2891s1310 [Marchantia polymorpha subsp. ruderalis]